MRTKILKNQIAVFGQFNFPPVPEVTISLMQAFAAYGLMPMVIKQLNPATGVATSKISLTKDSNLQIVFSSDRIDFVQPLPETEVSLPEFLQQVIAYLGCLQSRNLEFNRLAIVHEQLFYELSTEQRENIRIRLLPSIPPGSIEWIYRWVNPEEESGEMLNVCFEAARLKGMFETNVGTDTFDGVKFLHDISTIPDKTTARFNVNNVSAGFGKLMSVYERQSKTYQFEIS